MFYKYIYIYQNRTRENTTNIAKKLANLSTKIGKPTGFGVWISDHININFSLSLRIHTLTSTYI